MKRVMIVCLSIVVTAFVLTSCAVPTGAPTAVPATKAVVVEPTKPPAQATVAPKPTDAPKPTTAASPAAATKSTAVPQPSAATKFTFWHSMSGSNGDAIFEMTNRFNASQSKCYGQAIFQGAYDDSMNKLKAGIRSNDIPTLFQMFDVGTQLIVDLKVIEPIQGFIDRDKYDLSTFEENVLAYYSQSGKLNGMPFNTSAPLLYYNKEMFKAAGLDPNKPPRTYAEVLDTAKKLTKKDASGKVTAWGFGISVGSWYFEELNAVAGGLFLNNGNGRDMRATAAAFNSPEGVAVLNFWKEGVDAGTFNVFGRQPSGTDALVSAFNSQQVGMFIESTSRLRALINSSAGKFELGTGYIPRPNEDAFKKSGVVIGGASVYILQGRPDAEKLCGWEYVKFIASPLLQAYWHTSTGYYPVTKKAYDEPSDKAWVAQYPQFLVAVNQLRDAPNTRAAQGPLGGAMLQSRTRIENAIEEMFAGKATPKEALDKAAIDVTNYYTDYNKTVQ